MTPLRLRMINDMQIRNLSPHTQESYLLQVSQFARHFAKSPALLGPEDVRAYQVYLTNEKKLAPKSKSTLESLAERSEGAKAAKRHAKPSLSTLPRTPQEEEEDAYIAYLERKLGWVKGGKRTSNYGKGGDEDGLDGMLDVSHSYAMLLTTCSTDLLRDLDAFETSMPSSMVSP